MPELTSQITDKDRAHLTNIGVMPIEHGGHDYHYIKGGRSLFCPCGAWMGFSSSGGPHPLPAGWERDTRGAFGRCPLAGGP